MGDMLSIARAKEKADNRMVLYTIIFNKIFPSHQRLPGHEVM